MPGGSADAPCLEDLAKKTFQFAMCSCTDITISDSLLTDAVNSVTGDELLAGSVGANGKFNSKSSIEIGGSLWVGGETTAGSATVEQNLRTGGKASFTGLGADRNAYCAADISAGTGGTVTEDLYISPSASYGDIIVGGQIFKQAVAVPEPCDCKSPVPFGPIVDAFKAKNDNDALGIPLAYDGGVVDIELPCGRFFFTGLHATNTLSIHLTGRTVIAVSGDIDVASSLVITLDEGASLDLFVDGELHVGNSASIGLMTSPVSTRIYSSGAGITLGNSLALYGNIYMPNSPLSLDNSALVEGAVFAKNINVGNSASITYDAAILDLEGCKGPPQAGCDDCNDCGGATPACGGDGVCGPCVTDADCCGPTVCLADGTCAYAGPK